MSLLPKVPERPLLLTGILVVAALLRVYWIDQPYVDFNGWRESSTAMMAENIYLNGSVLSPEVNWDGPGPSYNGREFQLVTLLASVLYQFVGQVDWPGRAVGVMFGLWGIFALYKLISVVWDARTALAGAAFMAVLPGSLFIDREFLPDPAMVALVTTGCWLSVAYLRFGKPRDLAWAAIAMTMGVLAKLTGLCVGLAVGYAAWRIRSAETEMRRKHLLWAGVIMMVPVTLYYVWAWYLSHNFPPYHFAGAQGFVWKSSFAAWWAEGYFVGQLVQELTNIWTGIGLVLIAAGLALRRFPAASSAPWFFHCWLIVSGASYYLIGASHLVWQPYNLHLFDPPAAALAGSALISLADLTRRYLGVPAFRLVLIGVPVALALSGLPYLRTVYGSTSSSGHRMGLALREMTDPGDLVITIPEYAGDPVAIYYSRRHGWVFPPAYVQGSIGENWDEAIMVPEAANWLDHLRGEGARWLALVLPQKDRLWKLNPEFAANVERHFEIRAETPDYVIFRVR